MSHSSLSAKLTAALASRDERLTRRRLPHTHTAASSPRIDFNSNDYLSLSTSQRLRNLFLQKLKNAPDILGSGGSRLLVNGKAQAALEERLRRFFGWEAALLFNSGYDANIGFFSCLPQSGDVVVHDQYIHASVYDGMKASRARNALFPFLHNCLQSLRQVLEKLLVDRPGLRSGATSVFLVVESVYSMEGTFSPLLGIVELLESLFPKRNAHLVVDEVHATGIYGPQGRGRVAQLRLESKVLACLHTFGKALAASGAVILTSVLIRDYLLNYARSIIYTTSLSYASAIAIDCSFDLLEDGTSEMLSSKLLDLSSYFVSFFRWKLAAIPSSELLSLPSHHAKGDISNPPCAIIPVMTSLPWSLSAYLIDLNMNVSPITFPTIPQGKDCLRICLHASNTKEEVEKLAISAIRWAEDIIALQEQNPEGGSRMLMRREAEAAAKVSNVALFESKL